MDSERREGVVGFHFWLDLNESGKVARIADKLILLVVVDVG